MQNRKRARLAVVDRRLPPCARRAAQWSEGMGAEALPRASFTGRKDYRSSAHNPSLTPVLSKLRLMALGRVLTQRRPNEVTHRIGGCPAASSTAVEVEERLPALSAAQHPNSNHELRCRYRSGPHTGQPLRGSKRESPDAIASLGFRSATARHRRLIADSPPRPPQQADRDARRQHDTEPHLYLYRYDVPLARQPCDRTRRRSSASERHELPHRHTMHRRWHWCLPPDSDDTRHDQRERRTERNPIAPTCGPKETIVQASATADARPPTYVPSKTGPAITCDGP